MTTKAEEHMELVNKVLSRLQDAGFTINPSKGEWAVKETEFLGHWVTPTEMKPVQKKVDAILKMEAPQNSKQLRSFLGLVILHGIENGILSTQPYSNSTAWNTKQKTAQRVLTELSL
jgi:hypothetical protein